VVRLRCRGSGRWLSIQKLSRVGGGVDAKLLQLPEVQVMGSVITVQQRTDRVGGTARTH